MMNKMHLLFLAGVAPLLLGADSVGVRQSALSVLPSCADSEFLVFNKAQGGFVCKGLSGGSAMVPDCTGQLLNSAGTVELPKLGCTAKGSATVSAGTLTKITTLEDNLTKVGTIVTTIETSPPSAASYYAGATANTYKGAIMDAAGNIGVAAAAANCAVEFGAGAHMCSVYELYHSVAQGRIKNTDVVPQGWAYMASWSTPVAGPDEPSNGLNDNCAGYTYPTGDKKWTGTSFSWAQVAFTGRFAPKFIANTKCSDLRKILCCK